MPVVEIDTITRLSGMPARHGLPTWYRARHLVGLVSRSHLMIIDLEQGDTALLVHHLSRITTLSREAGLYAIAAEAERLRELVSLSIDPDLICALRRLHDGILALRAGAPHRPS